MNRTLDYYNIHAKDFAMSTQKVDMHAAQDRFLRLIPDAGSILDFGCGSGRDAAYFLEKGYKVAATDGSEELCHLASEYTGIKVRHMLFQELDEEEIYDGIWACSSILHLPRRELLPVLIKMCRALKDGGVIYTSFKYGSFEGERKGRFFTDFTEESFEEFMKGITELAPSEHWISNDVRPGRGEEKWLNLILRKESVHAGG